MIFTKVTWEELQDHDSVIFRSGEAGTPGTGEFDKNRNCILDDYGPYSEDHVSEIYRIDFEGEIPFERQAEMKNRKDVVLPCLQVQLRTTRGMIEELERLLVEAP